ANFTMMALPLKAIEPAAASNKPVVKLDLAVLLKSQPPGHLGAGQMLRHNLALWDRPCAK
ncbi:MAG: hypothetical protein RI896_981, partial [Pseudomonadota bacterium]